MVVPDVTHKVDGAVVSVAPQKSARNAITTATESKEAMLLVLIERESSGARYSRDVASIEALLRLCSWIGGGASSRFGAKVRSEVDES